MQDAVGDRPSGQAIRWLLVCAVAGMPCTNRAKGVGRESLQRAPDAIKAGGVACWKPLDVPFDARDSDAGEMHISAGISASPLTGQDPICPCTVAGLCASPAGCCWCPRPPPSIVSEQDSRTCRPSRLLRPAGGVQLQLRAAQKAGLTYPVSTTGRTTSICCITWALFACTSSLLKMSGHSFSLACRGYGRLEQENNFCGSDCEE